ncbi:hypothetical protein M3Y98_00321200 [Aphelenchoides besseyi]|nr:hypothetical protein M3Y98_00321200 [Aphelenchoides besseyi]KAI6201411.1 hypothetical protein M3Y96_00839000 [Aphelenchoides besseyi]
MSDPNKSSSSSSKYDSSFEWLGMEYDDFDVLVSDLNEHKLEELGKTYEIEHLGASEFSTTAFPVSGYIHGINRRYMIPLIVQRHNKPHSKIITVWFLVDSGSPFTCVTVKTLEAFYGAGNVVGQSIERKKCKSCGKSIDKEDSSVNDKCYLMSIQDQKVGILCKVSKGHFEEVNILGVDAMQALELSILVDWKAKPQTFQLVKT